MLRASIVVATYCPNGERYNLCKQSFSEIHQTEIPRDKYELIIVNNGGIHHDLIEALDTDVIVTNDRNIGQGAALNEGIAIARSNNLVLMDDDMSYKEGWLKIGLKLLDHFPKYVISLEPIAKRYIIGTIGKHHLSRKVGGNWIMRRSLYNQIGRFGILYYSFGGLWTRNLLRQGKKFIVSKVPYLFHLGRGKSIIGRKRSKIHEYRNTCST